MSLFQKMEWSQKGENSTFVQFFSLNLDCVSLLFHLAPSIAESGQIILQNSSLNQQKE